MSPITIGSITISPEEIRFYLGIIAVAIISIIVVGVIAYRKNAEKHSLTVRYKKNKKNNIYFLYKFFSKTPILSRYFRKVSRHLEITYPADRLAIDVKATQDMAFATGGSLLAMIFFIVFSGGDVFFILLGCYMTYVLFTQILTVRMERLDKKLDAQFSDFLSEVRHYYHETHDVVDSVYDTLEDCPYELGLHINKIYAILSGVHTEKDIEKYTDIAPNRFIMTFAAVAATIKEYGDKRLENGEWLFLHNLNFIKEELNVEILKKHKNSYLFSGLKFVAVAPIFFLKPIQWWAVTNMSELQTFYDSGAGTAILAAVFAISIICYQMISNLRDGRVDSMKENVLLIKLAKLPVIRRFLTAEINRDYSKSLRYGDDLKMVGEDIGPREFLLRRCIWAIALFFIFIFLNLFVQSREKTSVLTNFTTSFENSTVPSLEYRETMREASQGLIYDVIHNKYPHREELVQKISDDYIMRPAYANEVADELYTRKAKYENLYFKWYTLLIAILIGIIGFNIPLGMLKYQVAIMQMSMEDEVVQYHTLAMILMYVDGMTLDIMLEWMERFAFCFKNSISKCVLNLQYSQQKALEQMKKDEAFPAFKRFCDNLMAIDNVGIVSAFDEIVSEKEYYKKKREQDNQEMMEKKSNLGKLIAFIPVFCAVSGYMIAPFMSMALQMLQVMATVTNG